LWTVEAASGASRLVAGGYGLQSDPVWSPDGERILFMTDPGPWSFPDVGSYLEVVRTDGSGRTRITPKSPSAAQTVLPANSITPPDNLLITSVTVRPARIRRGGTVTARVVVESRSTGNLVDGAEVFAYARPAAVMRVAPRPARTRNGTATIRLRLLRASPTRRPIRLSLVASRPGDARVTSVQYLTQIPVRS
ncbi:MAG: hypothetical protein M3321_11945, partial [Actinomycetota bacterium]|nr:hypothetical protein [Actinomycetota bacterium]